MSPKRRTRWLLLALAGVLVLVQAAPATATTNTDDGLWYFDRLGVQDAHDQSVTGAGITIAMIDTPVNLDIPTLTEADIRVQDPVCLSDDGTHPPGTSTDVQTAAHGTSVLSLLVGSGAGFPEQTGVKGLVPHATVLTYYVQTDDDHNATGGCPGVVHANGSEVIGASDEMALSIHAAIDAGAQIISISQAVTGSPELSWALARAIRENVLVVTALPDDQGAWTGDAPARYNGVIAVNSAGPNGSSHQRNHTDVSAPGASILIQGTAGNWRAQHLGDGASLAAPIVAGNLALAMQKYPDATPAQLVQSLIHNAGTTSHEREWAPLHGYGMVNTNVFLEVDPTVYPDVHPLVHNFADMVPWVDDIWPGAVRSEHKYSHADRPWPAYDPSTAAPHPSPTTEPTVQPEPELSPTSTEPPVPPAAQPTDAEPGLLVPSVVIGAVTLIVIAVIITVVVIRSRRQEDSSHDLPQE